MVMGFLAAKGGLAMTATASAAIGFYAAFTTWFSERRKAAMRERNKAEEKANSILLDSLLHADVVKYFTMEAAETRQYDRALADVQRFQIRVQHDLAKLNFGQQVVNGLGLLGVLGLATSAASSGALSVGDVVAINALVLQLAIPLNNLGGVVRVVQNSVVDLSALRELLARSPEVKD